MRNEGLKDGYKCGPGRRRGRRRRRRREEEEEGLFKADAVNEEEEGGIYCIRVHLLLVRVCRECIFQI